MMPFMYHVARGTKDVFVVKIATHISWNRENVRWMADEKMGDFVRVPHLDIEESHHEFDNEEAAINFTKEWWAKQ